MSSEMTDAERNFELLKEAESQGFPINPEVRRDVLADVIDERANGLGELCEYLPDDRGSALGDSAGLARGVAAAHREDDDDVRARLFGAGGGE